MKIRSTVHWPEREVVANQVIELDDDEARARIAAGLAVEIADETPAPDEPAAI